MTMPGLAEYCDYLMIMAYDESYGPGPLDPLRVFLLLKVRPICTRSGSGENSSGPTSSRADLVKLRRISQGYGISCEKVEQFISSWRKVVL